jgi:hypothetical protein
MTSSESSNHLSTGLPTDLEQLANSYTDEKSHNIYVNTRKKLFEELDDIEIAELLKFKYARKLAAEYIIKYNLKNIKTAELSGLFVTLLGRFSYDEILNQSTELLVNFQINECYDDTALSDYDDTALSNCINILLAHFSDFSSPYGYSEEKSEIQLQEFRSKISIEFYEQIKTFVDKNHQKRGWSKNKYFTLILNECYNNMLSKHPEISKYEYWLKHVDLIIPYIDTYMKNGVYG